MDVTINVKKVIVKGISTKEMETLMATVEEIKQAIADEAAEVSAKVSALEAQIVALQEQVAAGSAATPEQLAEILEGVKGIFVAPSA